MPEEVVVDLGVLSSIGLGPAHQPLLLDVEVVILIRVRYLAEGGTLEALLTATQRAGESKAYRPAWMDSGIEHLRQTAAEEAVEELIHAAVATVLLVAMRQTEGLAIELDDLGVVVDLRPQLRLHIVGEPHIVVAREEVDLDTTVAHLSDLAEEAHVSTGDDRTVFEPVVEHIPEEVDRTRLILDTSQPAHQALLYGTRIRVIARAEVGITGEKDLLALAHRY